MRGVIDGIEITTAMVDVIDTLQNQRDFLKMYTETLDQLVDQLIMDPSEEYPTTLNTLRILRMIRHDLQTLASPPDLDDEENDDPAFEL